MARDYFDGEPPPDSNAYDSLFPSPSKKRRSGALVVVLVVLLGASALAAMTVGKPYLNRAMERVGLVKTQATSSTVERLERELGGGERARIEGDYAGAREAFLRATVVDERSLAAWDGLCTAESELAISHWVEALITLSGLERDQASSIGLSAGRSCARWAELARGNEDGAKRVATDLRAVRALAAQGEASGVRVFLAARPGDALIETLALLADATRKDPASIALAAKSASSSIGKVDLAGLSSPADLAVAAFVASVAGPPTRVQDALSELAKRVPRHTAIDALRSGGGGSAATIEHGADARAETTRVAASSPSTSTSTPASSISATTKPVLNPSPTPVGGATTFGGARASGGGSGGEENAAAQGDYRSLDEKGHKALAAGDVSKAETMFKAALSQHPGDIDANYGLGQIARSRGDHSAAIEHFKEVLAASAGFSPARLALADEQWAVGQKDAAEANYNLYLDRVPDGAGAARARTRTGKDGKKDEAAPSPATTE
ncbi:MAG: hypothetical protein NVSMB1_02800 [Polyangiales bacterium]